MSTSNHIQMTLIDTNQASPEVTANTALVKLEESIYKELSVAMGDANQTLTDAQYNANGLFTCTGALTAQKNLLVPVREKKFSVQNSTTGGYGVLVKTSGGTGVVVTNGDAFNLYCDGVNVISLGGGSSSSITLKTDGTPNGTQSILDLISGTGITITDNGDGTVEIESSVSGGMTNPMTTAGDIIYGGASGTPTRLAVGSEDSVLSVQSGNPAWRRKGQIDIITESTTSRTLALTDAGTVIRCTNGSSTNVTVPPNSSVAFSVGDSLGIRQAGAGQVTIVEGSGVTVNEPFGGTLVMSGQGAFVQLYKVGTDEWDLIGQVVSA